jgi:hypothetical protein
MKIARTYRTDPVIGIGDAGPMAMKVRADSNGTVYFRDIPSGVRSFVGAGFGYLK